MFKKQVISTKESFIGNYIEADENHTHHCSGCPEPPFWGDFCHGPAIADSCDAG